MSLLVLLVTVPLGDILAKLPKKSEQDPPKAYTEQTRLPGKPPAAIQDLRGAWKLHYADEDVQVGEEVGDIIVNMTVQFEEHGTYRLQYSARWGNPPLKGKDARGVTIDETGDYKLSGDVLIMDPIEVIQTDVVRNSPTGTIGLANEKHLYVVHWETRRIHLAGRCAPYQVDPICKDWQVENAWFSFKGPAKKVLGR